jgi:hypothetical protein
MAFETVSNVDTTLLPEAVWYIGRIESDIPDVSRCIALDPVVE